MSTPQPPSGLAPARAGGPSPSPPSHPLLDALRRTVVVRLQGLLSSALAGAEAELVQRKRAAPEVDTWDDDLTNVMMLRGALPDSERRWQEAMFAAFAGWPQAALPSAALDAYALVSDDELQAQLIGQPVIEAQERRHAAVLDVINSRLWSFAATLGGRERPSNPLSPRHLIDAFLHTFGTDQATRSLRSLLLRHYERLAGEHLGAFYASINTLLSDAGHAMATGNEVEMLMGAGPGVSAPLVDGARSSMWSDDNALSPTRSTWREGGRRPEAAPVTSLDAVRGNALREHVRGSRRPPRAADPAAPPSRELRADEFLAVLSLLQGDEASASHASNTIGTRLRDGLAAGAAGLGIAPGTTAPSVAQDDAIDLVALLFDGLADGHDLSTEARTLLGRLAPPYLRLALADPQLFDAREHPAMQLLSQLVQCWDANHRDTDADAELHALADATAREVVADFHGDAAVFPRLLASLQAALEPLRKRAEIAERRAWQSMQGRERLQAARRDADRHLARLAARPLLPTVAHFLDDQWRQSLIHAWLREGPESAGFASAVAVGDTIAAIDADAARAAGGSVAQGLIALQAPLRACFVACGVDENGAGQLLARLVGELAQPDARRSVHAFTPLIDGAAADDARGGAQGDLSIGQVLVERQPDRASQWLRLAWRSPLSGTCLLVTRQGVKKSSPDATTLAAMLADGRLQARSVDGPVEGVLSSLAAPR